MCSISKNSRTVILSSQVGVAVHYQVLISGGRREDSVSRNDGWVSCCCLIPYGPHHAQYILHNTILTPEGDVASSTYIRGSWVGLSESDSTFTSHCMIINEQ